MTGYTTPPIMGKTYTIPAYMFPGLMGYIEKGIPPGGFLTAVLENNLKESLARADEHNFANLQAYVYYLYNHAPAQCWGSKEKVQEWIEAKQAARIKECDSDV